jgi:hypothetical protein
VLGVFYYISSRLIINKVFVGLGFPFLENVPPPSLTGWTARADEEGFFNTNSRRWFLGVLYIIFSLYIAIVTFVPPYAAPDDSEIEIKGWYYPAIAFSIIIVGAIYYAIAFSTFIMSIASATVRLHEDTEHDQKYGHRKHMIVTPNDAVSHHQHPLHPMN